MKKRTFFALFSEIYRFWQFKAVILHPISKNMLNIVPLGWLRGAFLPRDTNQCNVCGSKSEGIRVLPTKTEF